MSLKHFGILVETQLPIADLSYQLGFVSQSHFVATFRRFVGVSPAEYQGKFLTKG